MLFIIHFFHNLFSLSADGFRLLRHRAFLLQRLLCPSSTHMQTQPLLQTSVRPPGETPPPWPRPWTVNKRLGVGSRCVAGDEDAGESLTWKSPTALTRSWSQAGRRRRRCRLQSGGRKTDALQSPNPKRRSQSDEPELTGAAFCCRVISTHYLICYNW